MGFLTVGRRFLLDQNEIIDDRIDVVCRGLLGLTVTCARCHDHKYDPIPTDDYYSLYGVFASSVEPEDLPMLEWPGSEVAAKSAEFARKLEAARKARDAFLAARRAEVQKDFAERFSRYLKAAYDLKMEARSARMAERALADKLDARRLRAVMMLWRRHLEATARTNDPLLAPWHAFAALPQRDFAAKAEDVRRKLTAADPRKTKAPAVHPLVAARGARLDPGEHGRGRRAVCRPLRPARGQAEGASGEGPARARVGVAPPRPPWTERGPGDPGPARDASAHPEPASGTATRRASGRH